MVEIEESAAREHDFFVKVGQIFCLCVQANIQALDINK